MIPLIILAFASIFIGYVMKDLFLGLGVDTWTGSLFQLPSNCYYVEAEFLPFYIKLIPFIFTMFGVFCAILVYDFYENKFISLVFYKKIYYVYSFLVKKWYFDIIYNQYIVKNIVKFGYHVSFKMIDRGLLEINGPYGIVNFLKLLIKRVSNLQSGLIYHYIFVMISSLCTIIFVWYLCPLNIKSSLILIYLCLFVYFSYTINNKKIK
jgi:NADH-ubiquinone oxidoreductase chain 5